MTGFAIPGSIVLMCLLRLATGPRQSELQSTWNGYDKTIRTFVAALALILFVIILVVGAQSYQSHFAP